MVKFDVNKSDRQFERISFSDIDCIKGLIKFRSTIDRLYGTEHGKASSVYKHYDEASVISPLVPELIVAYATLDDYLKKCNLNIKHKFIIDRLMEGHTEADVAKMFNTDVKNIISVLNTIANRIKKINDLEWKYDYIYTNILKADFQYKRCTRCNELKPATDDFYGKDTRNKDGFKGICKKCDAYKKAKYN